jgi:integrase/recombinase XerC
MLTSVEHWQVSPTLHWQDAFAAWLQDNNRAAKTVAAYLQDVRHLARWFGLAQGRPFELGDLQRNHVRAYFEWQKASKAAVNSRNRRLASLRVLTQWAMQAGILATDPTERIVRAEQRRLPPRAKEEREYDDLARVVANGSHLKRQTPKHAALGVRDRAIFALMGLAGLRIAEVAGLDVDDLRLEQGTIYVRGKGGVEGEVVIGQELQDILAGWMQVRPGQGSALITNWDGKRISTGQIRRRVELISDAAGIGLKPHDLRHTYVYRLLDKFLQGGMHLPVALDAVRLQARHGDTRTTMTYLRANYQQIKMAVEAL